MSWTIYKYEIELQDDFEIQMPGKKAEVLDVQVQHGTPFIWALVNPGATKETYRFRLRGTGHDATSIIGWYYIGTFQIDGGDLVFHLFSEKQLKLQNG